MSGSIFDRIVAAGLRTMAAKKLLERGFGKARLTRCSVSGRTLPNKTEPRPDEQQSSVAAAGRLD